MEKDIYQRSLELHKKLKGKIALKPKKRIETKEDLALLYTPGVAEASRVAAADPNASFEVNSRGNWVAVVSDGSAVLGLGNIGPHGALAVMEGKAILFKEFGDVDAFPLVLDTQDQDEIIETVKRVAPTFGGINLEDIAAPQCFYIEERLKKELDIPVFHDDQHGTAVVVLAGLLNAAKATGREIKDLRIAMSGAGAAGVAIAKLLHQQGVQEIISCDSKGIISKTREDLNEEKQKLLEFTNQENLDGSLTDALKERDVFIGVSAPGIVTTEMVKTMNPEPIIFAMANPTPEIMPDEARAGGAKFIATGRSDFPNQVNNVLAFPGIFRGALDIRARDITEEMKVAAAEALAAHVKNPTPDEFIPSVLDRSVAGVVAEAVKKAAKK